MASASLLEAENLTLAGTWREVFLFRKVLIPTSVLLITLHVNREFGIIGIV